MVIEPYNKTYPHYIDKGMFEQPIDNLRVRKPKLLGFASGIKNAMPNSKGGTMKEAISKVNYGTGVVSTIATTSNATFRLANKTKEFSPYIYWSGKFFENQYVTVYKISKLGRWRGIGGVVLGTFNDWHGTKIYDKFGHNHPDAVSPMKFKFNITISIYGILGGIGGASLSIIYFGLEEFYPGGFNQALENVERRDRETSKILGRPFRSIPYNKL